MKISYLFLAEGFEEIEGLGTVDVMRRAGVEVRTVSITADRTVIGAHGIVVTADYTIDQINATDADWLICPGGMPGASNLADCAMLCDMLKAHNAAGGHIAAICASPAIVLYPLGILNGRRATCYPGMGHDCGNALLDETKRVVTDGNVVTGNGPASTFAFALEIVTETLGADAAATVAKGMLV